MILVTDIGNTNIVIGGFEGDRLIFESRLSTNTYYTYAEYAVKLKNVLALYGVYEKGIDGAIISSVVPPLNSVFKDAVSFAFGVEPLTVGPGLKTGINLCVDNPAQVGADLVCAEVAAHCLYPGDSLVIDMGTATKFLAVDKDANVLGISIAPGVAISLKALSGGTAQLPAISLEAPAHVLGRNTPDCMRSGVIFGNAAMVDGMIDRICSEFGREMRLIATGGLAETIIPHCRHQIEINKELVLQGLRILYHKNSGNKK